ERTIFGLLIEILRNRGGVELDAHAIVPTVAEARADSRARIYEISAYDPDYPVYRYNDVVGYRHRVPELEALMRHAMVLRSEFPWNLEDTRCTAIGDLRGDEVVLVLHPRTADVHRFLDRVKAEPARVRPRPVPGTAHRLGAPVPPVDVRRRFSVMPRVESLAACRGERICTNEDLVRNAAYCWSPMTARDITVKTGIEQRTYTDMELEELSLQAARQDVEIFQTYASGPMSEVESIIWPNPEFDNNVTVYGPDVRALVKRYMEQMIAELMALPHPDGESGSLLDAIELVVPHQANKT